MKKKEKQEFGKLTIGVGTPLQREIKIIDFVKSNFTDDRLITISTLESDEGFVIGVENPQSTNRNPSQTMWLSKESFIGLMAASCVFWSCKGEDIMELLKESAIKNQIEYRYSDNLKPIKNKKNKTLI